MSYKTFTDIIKYLNIKKKAIFICDSGYISEIKDSLTNVEIKQIKTTGNKDHKIEQFSIKNVEVIDQRKLIPFNFLALYKDNKEKFPNIDILSVYSPKCITSHGNSKLNVDCYIKEITSTDREIHTFISKGGEELQSLKVLDRSSYVQRIFQHQHFFIKVFINTTDSLVRKLIGTDTMKLLKYKSFTQFTHGVLLGKIFYTKHYDCLTW